MKTSVQKWGNSLALRIPKAYAEETNIQDGSPVDLSFESGNLIIKPVRKKAFNLDQLLRNVTSKNKHSEVTTGDSVGLEVW